MEKMENLEQLGNIQKDIASSASLQRFLDQSQLSMDQMLEKSHSWFFENLKRELANRLSVLEAYFITDCNFHNFDSCIDIMEFLNDISAEVDEFLHSVGTDVEESEVDNA